MKYYLDIHGIGVAVDLLQSFPQLSELLKFEFGNFQVSQLQKAHISIVVSTMNPPMPTRRFLFATHFCKVFGFKDRLCIYPHGQTLQIKRTNVGFATELTGQDGGELFDILRMYILSSSGELLDLQGIHRLHCLGFRYENQNVLVSASSGGGKSYLAYQGLCENPPLQIFSDETCLVDNSGLLHGLALPIALKENVAKSAGLEIQHVTRISGERNLVQLPTISLRGPQRIHKIFVVTHWGNQFKATKAAFLIRLVFAIRVILGLGNMQMKEFMIRQDNITSLGKIMWWRFKRALYLLSHCEIYHIQLKKNSEHNLRDLKQYVDNHS